MPYIKKEERVKYNDIIKDVTDKLTDYGLKSPSPG